MLAVPSIFRGSLIAILMAAASTFFATTTVQAQTTNNNSYYTATNSGDCTARGGEWCPAMMGGNAWCSSPGNCPIMDEATCVSRGRKWCVMPGQTGSSGGCAMIGTECMGGSTGSGVNNTPPTTTNTTGTQTNTTPNTTTAPTTPVTPAPTSYFTATTQTDCTTRGGEWCSAMSGGNAWCGTPGMCPITDKATCEAKGRSWCTSTFGPGGCAMPNYDCKGNIVSNPTPAPIQQPTTPTTNQTATSTAPTDTTTAKPATPTQTFSWPTNKTECQQYEGKWCGSDAAGYCTMPQRNCFVPPKIGYMTCWDGSVVTVNSVCASMPTTEVDCSKAGKFWCNYNVLQNGSAQSGGFCSAELCAPAPPTNKMTCPNGRSFAGSLIECPHTAPKSFTCTDGTTVSDMSKCRITKQDEVTQCLEARGVWCADKSGVRSGFCAMNGSTCAAEPSAKEKDITRLETERKARELKKEQQPQLDAEAQKRAVQQMKSGIKNIERNLLSKKSQIEKLTKQKIVVDQAIIGLLNSSLELIDKVANATTYEEGRAAMEQLPDYFEQLNDAMPKLEQLSRLPKITKSINTQLNSSARLLRTAQTAATRQQINLQEPLSTAQTALDGARTALKTLTENAASVEDIEDFVQTEIADKLRIVYETSELVNALSNLRKHVTQLESQTRVIENKITALQKSGADVTDDRALLTTLKASVVELKKISRQKITVEMYDQIGDLVDNANETADSLRENLNIKTTTNGQKQILDTLKEGGEIFREIPVNEAEKLIVQAFNLAFRKNITRNYAFY